MKVESTKFIHNVWKIANPDVTGHFQNIVGLFVSQDVFVKTDIIGIGKLENVMTLPNVRPELAEITIRKLHQGKMWKYGNILTIYNFWKK